jgi:outer membrane receptor protein involved in Fe transport
MSNLKSSRRIKRLNALMASVAGLGIIAASAAYAQEIHEGVEDIIVTSSRRAEAQSRVPISIAAFTKESMDQVGIKQLSDLTKYTPGLVISNSQQNSGNTISLRGIASSAGSATTGLYIDDIPMQAAALGTGGYGQIYPVVFDLDRVEVLRGPQGTLFGSGSEGGTIRFIQAQPSLTDYSFFARAEGNQVGADSASGYEYGVAGGGPIIEGVLGFRASAYYRKQAGWVDQTQGNILGPNGLITGSSTGATAIQFQPTGIVLDNANWQTQTALRAALTWSPFEALVITPSIQYENHYYNYQGGTFLVQASRPESDRYVNQLAVPTVDATHVATPAPLNEPAEDQFVLPSLKVAWDINSNWSLESNTAMMVRKQYGWGEYPSYETTYARRCCVLPGDKADGIRSSNYNNYTQEVRLSFDNPAYWIRATAGYYYGNFRQEANQYSLSNYFTYLTGTGASAVVSGVTYPGGVTNGAPFGTGYSAWINYFGLELPTFNKATSPTPVPGAAAGNYPRTVSYYSHLVTHQQQHAIFAQAEFKLPWNLTATIGVRGSLIGSDITTSYGGATSNLYQPKGLPCVPGTGGPGQPACQAVAVGAYKPGTGPFQIAFPGGVADTFERAFTPKFGLSWQMDDDNMFYGTASKGFRPGGSQTRLNSGCDFQLIQLGYSTPTATGGLTANPPTQYSSDSVWNYEIGAKNRLLDGKLSLDTSAYLVTWRDIQSSVSISSCNQSIVDNLGGAYARGFDMAASYRPFSGLMLNFSGGFNETSFTGNTILGGNRVYSADAAIPNSGPPIRVALLARYDWMMDETPFYFVGDYSWQSKTRKTGTTDPTVYNYDANLRTDPGYNQVNARLGVGWEKLDISLFVQNLTDEAPFLGYGHTSSSNPVYTANTLQPRTVGVTVAYRN